MKKKKIIVLITIVVLAFCLIPNPFIFAQDADGGTRYYYPMLPVPVYTIIDYNRISADYDNISPDGPTKITTKGIQIIVLGISVYDGRYTVEGWHTR